MLPIRLIGESVTMRCTLLAFLFVTMDGDTDTSGLSKGPLNPADSGSRCAAMAGREDRAYLDCMEQAQRPAAVGQERRGTFWELPSFDHFAGRSHDPRRYPERRR
jgi:hypothetical protein